MILYIFGVWHKINSDFLDPEVSCAMALWRELPVFLSLLDHSLLHYTAIYGTLVVETIILVCLLMPRTRWLGIIAGIGFHSLLALSAYAFYAPFSMLTVALHLLYLSPQAARGMTNDRQPLPRIFRWVPMPLFAAEQESSEGVTRLLGIWPRALYLAAWFGLIWLLASQMLYTFASLIWLLGMIPLFVLVFRHARDHDTRSCREMVWSKTIGLNVVTLLFFFNCITPYLGLKTAQSINMFANLRLEGGMSNHLILSGAPGPFRYLEDLVEITVSEGVPLLTYVQRHDARLTYYHLLSLMQDTPGARVSFVRNGEEYRNMDGPTLAEDMDKILHPRWVRKWFHFNVVDLSDPKPCVVNR